MGNENGLRITSNYCLHWFVTNSYTISQFMIKPNYLAALLGQNSLSPIAKLNEPKSPFVVVRLKIFI